MSSFSFAVISDPHCAEAPGSMGPSEKTHGTHVDRFMRCVEAVEATTLENRPDFILVLGDIHIWKLQDELGRISLPLHVVAGNHESGKRKAELRALFPGDFQIDGDPSDYYSFIHKEVRFIGLCNAGSGGEHIGQLASDDFQPRGQCEWLESELKAPEGTKIVFAHIPPERDGLDRNMYMSRNDSRYFNDLVATEKPAALFFGHLHRPTREYSVGASQVYVVRSCSWNFDQVPLGFLIATVEDGQVTVEETLTS